MPPRKNTAQNKPNLKIDIKSSESSNSVRKWWFIEIWDEHREVFKTFMEHAVFFLIAMGLLILFDFIIKNCPLQEDKKKILALFDFYAIIICIGIFTVSFIIKLIILAVISGKKWTQIPTSKHQMIII
jgi:hypothetical protein